MFARFCANISGVDFRCSVGVPGWIFFRCSWFSFLFSVLRFSWLMTQTCRFSGSWYSASLSPTGYLRRRTCKILFGCWCTLS